VAPDELEAKVLEVARKLIDLSPLALKAAKEGLRVSLEGRLDVAGDYQSNLVSVLFATEDVREGLRAFIEKRPATFKGV
jgi:enoyl-CoA hydratase